MTRRRTTFASCFLAAGLLALALAAPCATLRAQDSTVQRDSLVRVVARLQRTVDSLRAAAERQEARVMELDERTSGPPVSSAAPAATTDSLHRTLPSAEGITGKPFVKRFGASTALGGYVEIAYSNDFQAHESRFDQVRLVPFIYSEITDKLHFGTEIEFEHGTQIAVEGGQASGSGEVNVEFATIDYTLKEALAFRAGIVLEPLGRFNLVHDSPLNELTARPLVSVLIDGATLSEAGAGLYGTVYPGKTSLLSYEIYLVNGFTSSIFVARTVPGDTVVLRIPAGEGNRGADNNFAKTVVARVAYSPALGLEVGVSGNVGKYARADSLFTGGEWLRVLALDVTWQRGRFALFGEWSAVRADVPAAYAAIGVDGSQNGYYLQASWRFAFGALAPRPTSAFTAALRWDYVDLSAGRAGDDLRRLTAGVNWRPIADAALKCDVQWNWQTPPGATSARAPGEALAISVATYF